MKTKLLVLVLLGWVAVVWGQKNDTVITINLSESQSIPGRLKKNTYVKFLFKNVNVFKVSGASITKSETIEHNIPEWAKKEINKSNEEIGNKNNNQMMLAQKMIDSIRYVKLKAKINLNEDYTHKQDEVKKSLKNIFDSYRDLKSLYELEERLNIILSDSIFVDTLKVKQSSEDIYYATYNHKDVLIDDYKKINIVIKNIKAEYLNLINNYAEYNDLVKQEKKENIYEKEYLMASEIYKYVNDNVDKISMISHNGITFYKNIILSKFEIYLPAQQLKEDITTISPQLKNRKGEVLYKHPPLTFYTYGGWKINISTGYFLSFIGNDNYTSYTNALGNKEVSKGNSDKITNALGGLMHVYYNNPKLLIQPGFSFGISLSDNSSIGFYAGVSAFFMEKNKLVTTFGYSFIKIKRLNYANLTPLATKDSYAFTNSTDTEIRYDNIYKGAWFFGVTYNISSNK
ncbi:hypothetical protein [Elizabethkingia anophelis]|uniref:hypothetical protein n=1 Tax=Elizabethkingia anophelis TaxID=1117645 RepID=UPI00293CFF6F|nr:hypothetical protein [Elizabethkingia anophelis]